MNNVLAHTHYGTPVTGQRLVVQVAGSTPYTSGVEFDDPDFVPLRAANKCVGNDDTCNGYKSGGTDLCSGHRKALAVTS